MRDCDGGKRVRGRRRHPLVDTEELMPSQDVGAADVSDQAGARRLLLGLRPLQPRLGLVWADSAYQGQPLASWAAEQGLRIEVVRHEDGQQGFAVQSRRRVVERTFAWLGRSRGLALDYERRLQSSEAFAKLALIHLMLRRLAPLHEPPKHALSRRTPRRDGARRHGMTWARRRPARASACLAPAGRPRHPGRHDIPRRTR